MKNTRAVLALLLISVWWLSESALGDTPAGANEMPPAGFWHLGLVVRDLDTMEAFYSRVIGLERVTDLFVNDARVEEPRDDAIAVKDLDELMGVSRTRIAIRHFSDPSHSQFLELLHYPDHPTAPVPHAANKPLGWNHLGIAVNDIDRVLAAMEVEGLGELVGGPIALAEFGGARYAFVRDPEGNLVELMEAQP